MGQHALLQTADALLACGRVLRWQYERVRVLGTRLLKLVTHVPCIVLFLVRCLGPRRSSAMRSCSVVVAVTQMPLLLRRMARLDAELIAKLQVVPRHHRWKLPS